MKKMFHKTNFMYKFVALRTFKNVVQPKIPMLDEINLENDMLATERPFLEMRQTVPTLAGDPRLPAVPHHKIREEVFEKWSRSSKCDDKKMKSAIYS